MTPIQPARPDLAPSHGSVVAMLDNGRLARFTITLKEWEAAKAAPVHFVEVDTVRGPAGGLVNASGHPLSSNNKAD